MQLAEQVFQTMTKKFSSHTQVWMKYGLFLMQNGRIEAARNLMKRSFKSLSKQQRKYLQSLLISHVHVWFLNHRGNDCI